MTLIEPTPFNPPRGKTLSDSSVSAVQYLTPTMSTYQTRPVRQRASAEQISFIPTILNTAHHKKARK